jgi:hypothetical protein
VTTYAFPTLLRAAPSSFTWGLQSNTQTFSSPLDGSMYTIEYPGARWAFTMQFPALEVADATLLEAFLIKLRGQANRFTMHNWARPTPRGTAGGSPAVNGGSQTGSSLVTKTWTAGATMKAGDYFGVNGELKMCIADSTANGSGAMTLLFEPPLRSSPSDSAAITVTRPTATFIMTEPRTNWEPAIGGFTSFSLQGMEFF